MHDDDSGAFSSQNAPRARMVTTEELRKGTGTVDSPIQGPTVTILCHRVEVNRETRPGWSAVGNQDGRVHLPLDLHLLLSAWDSNAEAELRVLGATMLCLEQHPVLSGPLLDPIGGWQPGDSIYLTVEELDAEDIMRIFDTLPIDFRLSVAYCARIAVIDGPVLDPVPDVTTTVAGMATSAVTPP